MHVRLATDTEVAQWDDFISRQAGGNIFATRTYAEIKQHGGYRPVYVMAGKTAVTILEKRTILGRLWYLPKGPLVTSPKELLTLLQHLKAFALQHGVFMIKIESELDKQHQPSLKKAGLIPAKAVIPNDSTITMDIKKDEDDLLASLPQKGRHAIRRAERDGVTIERVPATIANCKKMFSLLKKTAEGQFGLRPYDYYQQYWQAFSHAGHGQLFFARFEGKVVAGAYAMALGKKTTYKDGASSRKRTVYGASHLLQWEVIRWAKERGATLHDLCGSPPSDQIDNLQHPHYGIGRFKLSLSKNVVDYIGCMEVIIRPRLYRLWKLIVERIYQRLFYKRHRDYYY